MFSDIIFIGIDSLLITLNKIRYLFYLVLPSECTFSSLDLVPRFVIQVLPSFVVLVLLENIIRLSRGKSILRLNEAIASISQGICQESVRFYVKTLDIFIYCLVFDNCRFATLPWSSLWTWWFCFLFVDFAYYWGHRASHEINFFWAIHQAHHSSEEFNLIAGLRQAALQPLTVWIFFVPLALFGVPPQIFIVHFQLNELYMLWVHTEVIKTLGPLEILFNSPSHHRVHHGRNQKYIDKNYAGIFIFWDRMFGSFQPEDSNDPPVYGLVHPIQSYNSFYLQLHHWAVILRSMYEYKGWRNKLSVLFKGPGWAPNKPRLGYYDDVPEIQQPVTYWNPQIPLWQKLYAMWHFGIVLLLYNELTLKHDEMRQLTMTIGIFTILYSITSIGFLFENRTFAFPFECLRCILYFAIEQYLQDSFLNHLDPYFYYLILKLLRSTFLISAIFNALLSLNKLSEKVSVRIKIN